MGGLDISKCYHMIWLLHISVATYVHINVHICVGMNSM